MKRPDLDPSDQPSFLALRLSRSPSLSRLLFSAVCAWSLSLSSAHSTCYRSGTILS